MGDRSASRGRWLRRHISIFQNFTSSALINKRSQRGRIRRLTTKCSGSAPRQGIAAGNLYPVDSFLARPVTGCSPETKAAHKKTCSHLGSRIQFLPCASSPEKCCENSGTATRTHVSRYRHGATMQGALNGIHRQISSLFTAMPVFWPTIGSYSISKGIVTDSSWQSSTPMASRISVSLAPIRTMIILTHQLFKRRNLYGN